VTGQNNNRDDLIDFLNSIARPGRPVENANDDTNLIDAGLIDSLALIQIIQFLEESHGINLQASGIDPTSLNSISGILAAAEKATG